MRAVCKDILPPVNRKNTIVNSLCACVFCSTAGFVLIFLFICFSFDFFQRSSCFFMLFFYLESFKLSVCLSSTYLMTGCVSQLNSQELVCAVAYGRVRYHRNAGPQLVCVHVADYKGHV